MQRQDQFVVSTVVKFLRDHWISLDGVTCQILMDPPQSKTQLVQVLVALLEGLGVTFVQGNPDLATVIKDGGTLLVVGTPKIRDKLNSLIVDKDFISTISEVSEQKAVNEQNAVHRIMIPLLLHDELSLCFPDHPYFQQVLDFNVELFGEVFYESLKRLLRRIRENALDAYFRELVEPLKSHSNNKSCSSRDYYFNATMFNLTSISRTAINGVIDLPADGELGAEEIESSNFFHANFPSTKEEILRLVLENFKLALNIVISKAEEMKNNPKSLDDIDFTSFIRVLALTVNDYIIEKQYCLRNYNYKRFPYTKSSLLSTLFSDFCSEFMSKAQELSNIEDKKERQKVAIKFSAWIEYRLNLTDHFFSDGCTRVALLLSVFVFMLADCEVPIIINGANYFKNLPTKERSNLCEAQDQVQYSNWLKHYSSFFRLPLTVSIHDISHEFTSEGELMEYYQTVGLDNLHVISKSSSGATGYTAYEGKKEVLTGDHLSVSRKSGAVFSNFIGVMQYFRQEAVPKLEQCFSECKDRGNDEVSNISALEQCLDELIEGIVSRVLKNRKLPLDGREIRNYFRRKDSKYNSIDHQKLDEKYDSFLRELSQRLLKPNNYDIIETITLIDYRISFHYHFFLDGNIRIAQALILLICMFLKIRAPEFSEGMSRKRFAPRFPISADNYYEDEQFQFWSRYYRSLYGSSVTPYHGEFEVCLDREGLQITDFRKIYLSLEGSTLKYRTIWAVNPEYLQPYDENTDALIKAIEEDKLDRISLSLFNWLMRTLIERKHLADAKITAAIENVSYYKVCIDSVDYPADSNTIYLSSHDSKLFYRTTEVDGRYALDDCPEDDPSFNERIICLIDEKRIYDITLYCIERLVQTLTLKGHLMDIKSPAGLYSFTLSTDNDLDSIVDDSSLILLSCDHQNLFYRTACTDERQVLDPSNNNPILDHICWTLRYHLQINTLKDIPLSCFTWLVRLILEKNHLMDSKSFSNPWNVAWKNIAPEESTIFQNISRSAKEINILMNATGDSIKNMVVFNPTRMALHRGIIYVITRYNHELARKERLEEILKQMLADNTVSSSLRHLTMDFETAKEELGIYVHNHVFTDYFGMLKDQDLINFISNTRDKITKRVASGKCHIRPSQSRDIMKQLVIDKLLRDDFERKIEVVIDRYFSGETFITAYKEYKLSYMPNFERIAWAIVGGPASGKTSLVHFVNRQIQTSDYCVVNPDNYKHLLHTESVTSLKKNYAMLVHEESSFIADKILNELKSMVERDCAPNILLDTVKSSEEKMKVIGYGGATVFLNIASCPVEGETGALARAYKRASTKGDDFGRFVPTEEVLAGHKKESDILPETIRDFRVNLRLFDTSTGKKPRLTAVIDTHDKNMKVYYLPGFISFIKKGLINVKATNEGQAYYTNLDGKELARLLSEYIVKGISLIFLKDKATLAIMDRNGGIICNNYPLFRKEFDFFRQNTFVDDLLAYFITQPLVVMSNENHKIFLNIFIYDNTGSCILKRSPETGHKVMCSMKLKSLSHQIFNLVQPAALPPVP